MSELPIESPKKYGDTDGWEDAADDFMDRALGNTGTVRRNRVSELDRAEANEDVDETFLRTLLTDESKYHGRT